MTKKTTIKIFLLLFGLSLFWPNFGFATPAQPELFNNPIEKKQPPVNIYFFYSKTCPHCQDEQAFLQKLEKENSNIKISGYEVSVKENAELFSLIGKKFQLDISGVPFTIIGDKTFPGFKDELTTGQSIREAVACVEVGNCPDLLDLYFFNSQNNPNLEQDQNLKQDQNNIPEQIKIPFFGEIKTKNLSLPLLTIVIAGLDGFNPCAMWVLLFLISLLLGMENKKRMWILGSSFILASGLVYFLFLSAWLNIFLFLGVIVGVRIFIGAVALFSSGYNLREYWYNKKGICKVTSPKSRKLIFKKLRQIVVTQKFWLSLLGIIAMAFAVNLVELLCSAGLPAVYTQVLSLSGLPLWQYYAYLLLYIIIFMLDDIIIFVVAMKTLQTVGISGKYSRYSHLIGGILMLILGLLLIFKPGWLMFG